MMFGQSDALCHVSTTAQIVSLSLAIRSQIDANLLPMDWALKTPICASNGCLTLRRRFSDEVEDVVLSKWPSNKAKTCLNGVFTSRDGYPRVISILQWVDVKRSRATTRIERCTLRPARRPRLKLRFQYDDHRYRPTHRIVAKTIESRIDSDNRDDRSWSRVYTSRTTSRRVGARWWSRLPADISFGVELAGL